MTSTQSLFALASVLVTLGVGATDSFGAESESRFIEGELLVKFRGGPDGPAASQAKVALQHRVKRNFQFIGWQHIALPPETSVESALPRYARHPGVLAVEPNAIHSNVATALPNDPQVAQQYALARMAVPTAWDLSTGSSDVVVAILDTGINYHHEDLRDNLWRNPGEIPGNGIDDDGNGFVDDVYGIDAVDEDSDPKDEAAVDVGFHGTAVAGIIGAAGNNGLGVSGINWSVRLMSVRITGLNNVEATADQLQALNYVLLMKRRGVNIRVVNMSYGSTTYSQAAKDAHDLVAAEGIVQVAAAGNGSRSIDGSPIHPAGYATSNLISVAASTSSDDLASFSNYGRANVDLAAPGLLVRTTEGSGTNGYFFFSGTSAAVPQVAGAAALVAAAYPSLTAAQMKLAIFESVDLLPAFTNRTVTGGRLNVGRALYLADPMANAAPAIVLQPRSQSVDEDSPAQFSVIAAGTDPFRYRWRFNEAAIAGATHSFLQLLNVATNQSGNYSVVVSNSFGSVTSSVATLTVVSDPNPVFTLITNSPVVLIVGNSIGAAVGDCDNDGDVDLMVPRGLGNQNDLFFKNLGNGSFSNVTTSILTMDNADTRSGAWGDYDNDGYPDLFVANGSGQSEMLYHNNGGTNFTRMTAAQVGPIVNSGGESWDCAWFDYDNDGWLDALVANEAGQNEFLFRNNGSGTFTRITTNVLVNDGGYSFGVAIADYDSDGRPDVFVANGVNSVETNRLYHNEGNGSFTRVAAGDLVTEPALNRSGAWGDYDNDGDLDLYVLRVGPNMLFRNDGNGMFTRITTGALVDESGVQSNAAIWGDYDNDGFLDVFVATGGGTPHLLFHNNGDGSFRKITSSVVAKDNRTSAGCSWLDYDNDGHLDLFVTGLFSQTCLLYHNNGNTNGWLKVRCIGGQSNRSGIGAKVRVRATIGGVSRWQMREISGGGGFGSQGQLVAHFGLGDATSVEAVRVEWPSGIVQEVHRSLQNPQIWIIPINQLRTVVEPPQLAAVGKQPDGSFRFSITAAPGCYALLTSSDLITWTSGEGGSERFVIISNRTTSFIDSTASNSPSRFYRLIHAPACGDQ